MNIYIHINITYMFALRSFFLVLFFFKVQPDKFRYKTLEHFQALAVKLMIIHQLL